MQTTFRSFCQLRLFTLLLVLLSCTIVVLAQQDAQLAPLNPVFLDYQQTHEREINQASSSYYGLGELPPPMDISHLQSSQIRPTRDINGFPTS